MLMGADGRKVLTCLLSLRSLGSSVLPVLGRRGIVPILSFWRGSCGGGGEKSKGQSMQLLIRPSGVGLWLRRLKKLSKLVTGLAMSNSILPKGTQARGQFFLVKFGLGTEQVNS